MKLLKIKFAGVLAILLLSLYALKPAIAQAPPNKPAQSPASTLGNQTSVDMIYSNVNPDVPRNINTLSQGVVIGLISSATCMLAGADPLSPRIGCLGVNPKTGVLGYVTEKGGAVQMMGRLIGQTMSIPISSADYATYALDNFGVGKTYAQAEGLGYNRLSPLLNVWVKFRDIAYLLFVIAFTVIGLAIVFRVKIDARTVMTIQNQIPKIVISLILVTFSYAIAGFLIDIMYVLIYLLLLTFNSITPQTINPVSGAVGLGPTNINPNANIFAVVNKAFSPGIYTGDGIITIAIKTGDMLGSVFGGLATDFLNTTIGSLFRIPFIPFTVLDIGCSVLGGIGKAVTFGLWGGPSCNFVDAFFESAIKFVFGVIVFLVALIAIIYSLFRVWFTLIKSFVYVLLDAMLGPLWIAAGIFPGSKLGFTSWLRHIMGHLSVFPMTFAVILLGKTIMDGVQRSSFISRAGGALPGVNTPNVELFSPPLVGDAVGGATGVAALIGLGFIISLPGILDRTRKTVGTLDFGLTDIKKSLNAANPLAAAQQGSQIGGTLFGLSHLPGYEHIPIVSNIGKGARKAVTDTSTPGGGGGAHK